MLQVMLLFPLTKLSSFWYCGIFFNIWERSFMFAWNAEHFEMKTDVVLYNEQFNHTE